MSEEEIKKMFHRVEIDKSNDSCGFEFADGFDCTFDNIATCYDDRLKLYDLVKKLQQENNQLKEQRQELRSWLEDELKDCNDYSRYIENKLQELKARSNGKTYIANEIMKNEVTKKCFKDVLNKLNELEGGKNE